MSTNGLQTIQNALKTSRTQLNITETNAALMKEADGSREKYSFVPEQYAGYPDGKGHYYTIPTAYLGSNLGTSSSIAKLESEQVASSLTISRISDDQGLYFVSSAADTLTENLRTSGEAVNSDASFQAFAVTVNRTLDGLDQQSSALQSEITATVFAFNEILRTYQEEMKKGPTFFAQDSSVLLTQRNIMLYQISQYLQIDTLDWTKPMPPISVQGHAVLDKETKFDLHFTPSTDPNDSSPGSFALRSDGETVATLNAARLGGKMGGYSASFAQVAKQKQNAKALLEQIIEHCNSRTGATLNSTDQYSSSALDLGQKIDWNPLTLCAVNKTKDAAAPSGALSITIPPGTRTPQEQAAEINRVSSIYSAQRVTIGGKNGLQNIVLEPDGRAFVTGYDKQKVRIVTACKRTNVAPGPIDEKLVVNSSGVQLTTNGMQLYDLGLKLENFTPDQELYLAVEVEHTIDGQQCYWTGGLVGKLNAQGQIVFTPAPAPGLVEVAACTFAPGSAQVAPTYTGYVKSSVNTANNTMQLGGLGDVACLITNTIPKALQNDVLLLKDGRVAVNFYNQTVTAEVIKETVTTQKPVSRAELAGQNIAAEFSISLGSNKLYTFTLGPGVDTADHIYYTDLANLKNKVAANPDIPFTIKGDALDNCTLLAKSPGEWGNALAFTRADTTSFAGGTDGPEDVSWEYETYKGSTTSFNTSIASAIQEPVVLDDHKFDSPDRAGSSIVAKIKLSLQTIDANLETSQAFFEQELEVIQSVTGVQSMDEMTASIAELNKRIETLMGLYASIIQHNAALEKTLINLISA
ncbi:hypothetical protein Sarmat_00104 [Rickettsiales endosymbiont of Paramecium tredecaurelia]|uniref:FlgK family flagellar hook-associated protein n=1 Tax=Candidatus Sarmatiella mevalonica TaxID=2770581 RepID=UPI001921E670|nr:hypothetical protein [Candidatus Sarmatiella mevalonica]MBL3284264.1 hypothetical protein [Candidatus Sarmatiella mevalonica]